MLGLQVLLILLVFPTVVRGTARRARRVVALLVALVVAVLAVGFHFGCREAVWQANDELGRTVLGLAPAAYLLPIAAVLALFAAIALVTRRTGYAAAPPRARKTAR